MTRYRLGIEFVGTNYRGWQWQKDAPSVQQTLERALSTVANHPVEVVGAGRTDAGVHASYMVAHFDSPAKRTLDNWQRGAMSLLPADICILEIHPTYPDFHARFSCTARRYRYIIQTRTRPALLADRVWAIKDTLDIDAMQNACNYLLGTHDFSTFRASLCQARSPVRTCLHANISNMGRFIVLDIMANGFLHHMVRNITGALVAVGRGALHSDDFAHLLAQKNRSLAPPTAPAHGLYFVGAYYDQAFEFVVGPDFLH